MGIGPEAANERKDLPAVHAVEGGVEENCLHAVMGSGESFLDGGGFDDAVSVADSWSATWGRVPRLASASRRSRARFPARGQARIGPVGSGL